MTDFNHLHEEALKSDNLVELLNIYHAITEKAYYDDKFREGIDMNKFNRVANAVSKFPLRKRYRKSVAIIGVNEVAGKWDPSFVSKGLPGSEECVVNVADELAKRGCKVSVFMNPVPNTIYTSVCANPRWFYNRDFMKEEENYDYVILWRNAYYYMVKEKAKKVFYWPHDINNGDPNIEMPPMDGVFALSKYFYSKLCKHKGLASIPHTICGNGVLTQQFKAPSSPENPLSIGYYSNYSRGLEILINAWDFIRSKFPTATLAICYGRQHWGTIPEEDFKKLCDKMDSLKDKGVIEYGKVGHQELADIMCKTSIWAYPCTDMGETFCITAVKAQLAGCIPVATRIGALDETIHPDAPCMESINSLQDIVEYIRLLINVMTYTQKTKPEYVIKERQKYRSFAEKFSWTNSVNKMMELMEK